MAGIWTRPGLVDRLVARFRLSETRPDRAAWLVREEVVPVTQIEQANRATKISNANYNITTGAKSVLPCASGKRITLRCVSRTAIAGGADTGYLYVDDGTGVTGIISDLDDTTDYAIPNLEITMTAGMILKIAAGNAPDVAINVTVIYEEEDIETWGA